MSEIGADPMSKAFRRYGAIEGGGTKFVILTGSDPDHIDRLEQIETTTPQKTLQRCIDFLVEEHRRSALAAVGIGMFGPVDLRKGSSTYGYVTTTPKLLWQFTDIVGPLQQALGIPIGWENDVNAAVLGEARYGAGRSCDPLVYLTVGTGVGGGVYVGGRVLHGLLHPEMGHVLMPSVPGDDFEGACPFHGRCLEGLVSGPAIEARCRRPASMVPMDDPAWGIVAEYLGAALMDISLILSPERIVLGGGVIADGWLLPKIREVLVRRLQSYLAHALLGEHVDEYVVSSALGGRAGVIGALAVAREAAEAEG
ncbi:MAG: ROK family protein [Chloroflexi bacterium]|nr:ROK family protein [Chloroflexota bacterium]